jgi:hypothetical protein
VANLTVYRGFAVSRATLGISLRFIDRNNGLLYGEIKETVKSHPDGGGFDIDDDSPESTAELKKIFESLVRQSVDIGLSQILSK